MEQLPYYTIVPGEVAQYGGGYNVHPKIHRQIDISVIPVYPHNYFVTGNYTYIYIYAKIIKNGTLSQRKTYTSLRQSHVHSLMQFKLSTAMKSHIHVQYLKKKEKP